jgi:DNA adenine methylase
MNTRITPLRYPGGKQKLTPFVKEIIEKNSLEKCAYFEPYAGGAGVAVSLLVNGIVEKIYINDISVPVYAFWYSIINNTENFIKKVRDIPLTINEWENQHIILRNEDKSDLFSLGFSMFYMNRCNRSGILNAGVIGGKSQEGRWKINARFNRADLIQRISCIASFKDKIQLSNKDALTFLKSISSEQKKIVYLDPPYYHKADKLYDNYYHFKDHKEIANFLTTDATFSWITSYDDTPEIESLYQSNKSFTYSLQYNAAKAYKGKEIFIFSPDLNIPESSSIGFINTGLKRRDQLNAS